MVYIHFICLSSGKGDMADSVERLRRTEGKQIFQRCAIQSSPRFKCRLRGGMRGNMQNTKKSYKALVFDYDMTIADTGPIIVSLLNQTARHFGYPEKSYEQVASMIGHTQVDMLRFLTEEEDMEKLLIIREHYRALCREEMCKRTTFFPGLEESLKIMKEHGLKLGILSLKLKDLIMASLEKYKLTGYFDVIFGAEEMLSPKPDPRGLFSILEKMGLTVQDVLYVGDSLVDEETARNAGADFCAMLSGATRREQFDENFVKLFCATPGELAQNICG